MEFYNRNPECIDLFQITFLYYYKLIKQYSKHSYHELLSSGQGMIFFRNDYLSKLS